MRIERVHYRGWQEAYRCWVGPVELVVVTSIGPRILSLRFDGGENVLYEDETDFGLGAWRLYGGQRLATAPESAGSYTPDNTPCDARDANGGLLITQRRGVGGWRKTLSIGRAAGTPGFELVHGLTNLGDRPWVGALWSCTCVKPDGSVRIARPSAANHGPAGLERLRAEAEAANDREIGTPVGRVGLLTDAGGARYWTMAGQQYASPTHAQWGWTADHFVIRPPYSKGKVGLFSPEGDLAFVRSDLTFRVRATEVELDRTYPHGGCNLEVYTSAPYLELETLGPLTTLAPGGQLTHREEWRLARSVRVPAEHTVDPPVAWRRSPQSSRRESVHE